MKKFILTIVIPVYNEENAINGVFEDINANHQELIKNCKEITELEVIFVNDGSSDKTHDIISSRINEQTFYKMINHKKKQRIWSGIENRI